MSNAIDHVVRWWLTDPYDAEGRTRSREAVQKLAGASTPERGHPHPSPIP
jgi:hypothetical protein